MPRKTDFGIVRDLASRYAEFAAQDVQQERLRRYRDTNDRRRPRPIVLIDEVPFGEMGHEDELALRCTDGECREMERYLRLWLFRWNHVQGDLVLPAWYPVAKRFHSTGNGFSVQERTIPANTGSEVLAHEYVDQLKDESAMEKFRVPTLTCDPVGTERAVAAAREILGDTLPVRIEGHTCHSGPWDEITQFRGVGSLLFDLADRPAYMHRLAEKLVEIHRATLRQMEELNLLEPHPVYLHCTPASTDELPPAGFDPAHVRAKDVWARHSAQVFSGVSPAMHDEFDVTCALRMTESYGLLYYGCCEPLDRKIDILRKLKNLRKISITPWADVDRAADSIGKDYVLSFKPNPAFVAVDHFDPEPVRREISRALAASRRNGTTVEIILKDISSVRNRPQNLFEWERTVKDVISREF